MNNNNNISDYKITGILNEDGTEMNYPINPLKSKWDALYPPNKDGVPCSSVIGYQSNGAPYMNYGCVLCTEEKCQHSPCWKVPEEDKEKYNKYLELIMEYDKIHNPSIYELKVKKENNNGTKN